MNRQLIQNGPHINNIPYGMAHASTSSMAVSNDTNYGAVDLTLNAFTGNHFVTHNNYGTVQNNAQIGINYVPQTPIDCVTHGDDNSEDTAVHQQSVQSVQSAGQSFHPYQRPQMPVNFIAPELAYVQPYMSLPSFNPISIGGKRPIIIDGLNIGYSHGCHKKFSAKGISLCVQYFQKLGFPCVKILLPHHHRGMPGTETHNILKVLMGDGFVYFTPSRKIQNVRLTCYSDRIILDYAHKYGGVVVSNDNFRDLYGENERYKDIIENRHIMIMFIDDDVIIPLDQYSRRFPNLFLGNILHFPA